MCCAFFYFFTALKFDSLKNRSHIGLIVALKIVLLVFLLASLACTGVSGDGLDRFRDGRGKTDTRARDQRTNLNSESAKSSSEPESFVFPFLVDKEQLSSMSVSSSDNIQFRFSGTGGPLTLLASYSGLVSLEEGQLILSPSELPDYKLYFQFQQEGSTISTSHQAQVKQKQLLLKSSAPIVVYVTYKGTKYETCFNLEGVAEHITVNKDLPVEQPDCS